MARVGLKVRESEMQRNRTPRFPGWVPPLVVLGIILTACGGGGDAGASSSEAGADPSVAAAPSTAASEGEGLLAELREAGVVRVANTQANPPFSFLDESNEVVGYDVDVANEVASRLGIGEVEFIRGTFQTFISGLETDKWDVVIAGLTPTDERRQQVDFTCPYQVNALSIFVNDTNTTISGERDLEGQRIAVSAGSTQEQQAKEIPGATVQTYEAATLALTDVSVGRADAYLGSRYVGSYLAEENGLAVQPLEDSLDSETNAIAVPKGEEALMTAINQALVGMLEDGTLSEMSREWFGGLDMAEELRGLTEDC